MTTAGGIDTGMTDKVLRGRVLTFVRRPRAFDDDGSYEFWDDGAVAISSGKIVWRGGFGDLPNDYAGMDVVDHRPGLILPGFIDAHAHYVQMRVIASYGTQLLDWLERHTFPEEARFEDAAYAEQVASHYLDELIRQGVTTAVVYGSSHKASMDAFFSEAHARGMCMIAGKTLMDRGAPAVLLDTARSGYDDSKALINAWHGKGRLHYAITPRFAITCSAQQLELAGTLLKEEEGVYLQTHLSENHDEIEETLRLYPSARDYLDVYETAGLLGERSLFGHCLHLTDRERDAMRASQSVAVFCPTSNTFLGSGLFDYDGLRDAGIPVALASDVGGGTSYSMLATAAEAYKVCQMRGYSLNPLESFYQMTRGNADALSMADQIGSIEPQCAADLIVLDSLATPAMTVRMETAESLQDELFVLQTLGDDRSITATYVAGRQLK